MTELLTYDLKVAVLIAVFYMFYRLLLARETFHRVNRVLLLLTALASFVLPLCVITLHETVVVTRGNSGIVELALADISAETASQPFWQVALPVVYIIGVMVMTGRLLLAVGRVLLLIRRSERHPQDDGTVIAVSNESLPPFSFFSYIVLSQVDYEEQNAAILTHERGHINEHHSFDVILVDLLTALQWFNPAMWMLRQDLRQIHEYEADAAVLSQGINARQYQYLLVSKAAGIGGYSIANGINHSTLKNRIIMMQNKNNHSHRRSLLKLLALVPIVATALALNAETVRDVVYVDPPQKKIVKKGRTNQTVKIGNQELQVKETVATDTKEETPVEVMGVGTIKKDSDSEKTFDVVEQMPQFPGGMQNLLAFLNENVHYPEACKENNVQGRVIVSFVIEKDGTISEPKVVRSVSPELDAEGIRVVSSMPKWTPGYQRGEPVSVRFTLPISFKLQGGEKKKTESAPENVQVEMNANVIDIKEETPAGTAPENIKVEIDGKSAKQEDLNALDPSSIKSIAVIKGDDGQKKIIVTTKK